MLKKSLFFVFILALAAAGGGYYWFSYHASGSSESEGQAQDAPQGRAQPVSVITLEQQQVNFTHTLPGRVSPYRQSQVRPQVDGIITERLFEEGAHVEKGQQLYQIDDARYRAALNSAIADLKSAEANVKAVESRANRYKELVKINAVSAQEYDDAKAQLDQAKAAIAVAQAAVDVAQVNLDYTKVYAPIAGRIGKSFVTEGALVTANQEQHLAVITQLDPVYIDMQQSGSDVDFLRNRIIGQNNIPVTVILNEATGERYEHQGTLKFSEVTIDESAGSIALRALMPNPDGVLLSGLYVRATLDLGAEETLLVPQRATMRQPDGSLQLWIVDDNNTAQPRTVQVEQARGSDWVVQGGVKAGDTIIVKGYQKVGPGAAVAPEAWEQGGQHSAQSQSGKAEATDTTQQD